MHAENPGGDGLLVIILTKKNKNSPIKRLHVYMLPDLSSKSIIARNEKTFDLNCCIPGPLLLGLEK